MTPLRRRMIEDMQLRGLSERTQETYTRAVRQLAEHYGVSPDQLREAVLAFSARSGFPSEGSPAVSSTPACRGLLAVRIPWRGLRSWRATR